jgi:hypothetical protein
VCLLGPCRLCFLPDVSSELLGRLRPVTDGRYTAQDAPAGCMANTRLNLLQQIMDWAKDSQSAESVFWLTGPAGTGKSAIMRTMCERLDEENLLGASFFISRSDEKRSDPQNIVRTLIHNLAKTCSELRGPICDALRRNDFISDDSMDRQLQVLISKPYARAAPALDHPVVLVLDGLDECEGDKDSGREGGELLPLLLRTIAACHPWLKLLIASRQEKTIDKMFGSTRRSSLRLQDQEQSTRMDIERYLTYSLHAIAQAHSQDLPHNWPGDGVIRELTGRSGSLFIYADTVVKLLKRPDIFPDEIITSILSRKPERGTYAQLDAVYKHILGSAFSSTPFPDQRHALRSHLRDLLGVLLACQAPVSVAELATFLELDTRKTRLVLESISAVVVTPEDNVQCTTRLFHTSFSDFLLDSSRCTDLQIAVDVQASHDRLAVVSYKLVTGVIMGPREYADNLGHHHLKRASLSAQKTAINLLRMVLRSQPPGLDGRLVTLGCLTLALQECYNHGGGLAYLQEAVHHRREMVKVGSGDESILGDLAYSLQSMFDQTGEVALLDEVIALNRRVVELQLTGHPARSIPLNNLAAALLTRFKRTGEAALLDEVIDLDRKALELRPRGHPTRDYSLSNLGHALRTRFEQTGEAALLDEVIDLNREALELRPPGHPTRATSLSNLGLALLSQFNQTGGDALLDEVIALNREALELCLPGHPNRGAFLGSLGLSLYTRFNQNGEAALLDEVIALHREALKLRPPGHPSRDYSLSNLGLALLSQFNQTGEAALLDEVIALNREALELCPPGDQTRATSLSNLAGALITRFQQTKEAALLDEVITLHSESLDLCPPGDPTRGSVFNNLAYALLSHYKHHTDLRSLDQAVALFREAHNLHVAGHIYYESSLVALADALIMQFNVSSKKSLLTESINLYRQAVNHTPTGHPEHFFRLRRLAGALRWLNATIGAANALEEAEWLEVEAAELQRQVRWLPCIDTVLVHADILLQR